MHLLQTYALSCGLKIDRPYVFENYTTVPYEKFISFNRNQYPYFMEVVSIIKPALDKLGIGIVQLKASQNTIDNDVAIFDSLNFGQWAYIIKHSMLHFGEDDFLFDLCGYYDIPRVILFSNTFPENFKPYWGSEEKQRILTSVGPFKKPSLSGDPNQNFVRFIPPEEIASNIMELLGIPWQRPYKTVYAGSLYRPRHDIIELVPNSGEKIDISGSIANVAVRMDYKFDENMLISVLQRMKVSIITNKPININIIKTFRPHIQEILYIAESDANVDFAKSLTQLNIPYLVTSYEAQDKGLKEKFFEICVINQINTPKLQDIKPLKDGLAGLVYKSSKRIMTGKEYKSRFDLINNIQSKPNELTPCPIDAPAEFMKELEYFFIVKPIDTETKIN